MRHTKPAEFAEVAGVVKQVLTDDLGFPSWTTRELSRDIAAALTAEFNLYPRPNTTYEMATTVHLTPQPDRNPPRPRINPPPFTSGNPQDYWTRESLVMLQILFWAVLIGLGFGFHYLLMH